MLTDVSSTATDHEARNRHLSDIDETWEVCQEIVELARAAYEDALEEAGMVYDSSQGTAAASHREAIDAAWAAYKEDVTNTPSMSRREAIAGARATYNKSAAEIRSAYESGMAAAREALSRALQDARLEYEVAVEGAFEAHRKSIENVRQFLDPTESDSLDVLGLAGEQAARGAQPTATPTATIIDEDDDDPDRIAEELLSSLNGNDS
jgi:hypothetical protein